MLTGDPKVRIKELRGGNAPDAEDHLRVDERKDLIQPDPQAAISSG